MSEQAVEVEEANHYSMILEWEPKDRIYVVTVPELSGCRTHGDTVEEAVRQGRDAIEGWIEAMRHWGRPIPPPHYFAPNSSDAATVEAGASR